MWPKGFDIVYICLTCINIKYSISQRPQCQVITQSLFRFDRVTMSWDRDIDLVPAAAV